MRSVASADRDGRGVIGCIYTRACTPSAADDCVPIRAAAFIARRYAARTRRNPSHRRRTVSVVQRTSMRVNLKDAARSNSGRVLIARDVPPRCAEHDGSLSRLVLDMHRNAVRHGGLQRRITV